MAITRAEIQVTWPTAVNSKSVAFGASQESEEFNLDATTIAGQITVKADNDGTPAAGDTIDFYLLRTSGDPDGASGDEFDASDTVHPLHIAQLDTNTSDPSVKTVDIPIASKGAKLRVVNNSSGRAITVSAAVYEVKAA